MPTSLALARCRISDSEPERMRGGLTHGSQDREASSGSRPRPCRSGLVSQTLLRPWLDLRAGQTAMQAAPWQVRIRLCVPLPLWTRESLRPQLAMDLIQVRPPLLGLHLAG